MTLALLIALSLAGAPDAGQRRTAPPQETKTNVTIALNVGASAYKFSGPAKCEHLPKGSIYNTVAERWTVQQEDGGRNLSLTVWKPLAGGENLITLYIAEGGKRQDVQTTGPKKQGSGTITFDQAGRGGVFTIAAISAAGAKISGTVKCDAFTDAMVEGGD